MLVLTIDTSTPNSDIGHAVLDRMRGRIDVWGESAHGGRGHVELLAPLVETHFTEYGNFELRQAEAIVVGVGPGPYTGLRIGIATAAALGDALGIPVHGVCGLDAIAARAWGRPGPNPQPARDVVVVTDAKRREVYWARYREGRRMGELGVSLPAELPGLLGDFVPDAIAGAGELLRDTELGGLPTIWPAWPCPWGLAQVAAASVLSGEPPEPLVPLYLRPPDAKPPAAMKGVPA